MSFVEDLSAFLSTDEFAIEVEFVGATVRAIFDNGVTLTPVGAVGMMSTGPSLTLPTADVPANPVGQAVTVAGVAYTVAEHQPDGTGVSVLLLERAA